MKEQIIEEMAVDLCLIDMCKHLPQEECNNTTCAHCEAEAIYNAGYRKIIHCKDCAYRDTEGCPNTYWNGGELESNVEDDDFCSGAHMKGGAE